MINFVEMLEFFRRGYPINDITANNKTCSRDSFIESAVKAVPFVFSGSLLSGEKSPYESDEINLIDTPFEVISLELAGDKCLNITPREWEEENKKRVSVLCTLLIEDLHSTEKYKCFNFIKTEHLDSDIPEEAAIVYAPHMISISKEFVDIINSNKMGIEKTRFRVKTGAGKSKQTHTIRNIVHIKARSDKKYSPGGHREVDWSHQWAVRGHWRKTSGIGKDREGNYGIQGNTWVKSHVKGPDHLKLITKTRIVE